MISTPIARAFTTAALFTGTLAFTGCERQAATSDYFPMRDGNRWEYRLLDQARLKALAAGQAVPTATAPDAIDPAPAQAGSERKAEVLDEARENATGAAQASTEPARRVVLQLKESVDDLTFRATYDGYEQVWSKRGGYVGSQNANGRQYLLILPPHSGYRWVVTDPRGLNLYYEVEGHQDLETPSGSFKQCAITRQENRDKREVSRYWFAPGVGLVRRSKYYLDEEVFRQELVAHDVRASLPAGRLAEEQEIRLALKGKKRGTEHQAAGAKVITTEDEPKP